MIPHDRQSLINYCHERAIYFGGCAVSESKDIGPSLLSPPYAFEETKLLSRRYWCFHWIHLRWLDLAAVVAKATYEGDAYKIVCDFEAYTTDNLMEMSRLYVDEKTNHLPASQSFMFESEREKLIAKLTEDTVKIGAESIEVVAGAIVEIVISVLQPVILHRLAFGEDVKRLLRIEHLHLANRVLLDRCSAEAFGDPGAIIPPSLANEQNVIYPGMPLRLRLTNISACAVKTNIWIACRQIIQC